MKKKIYLLATIAVILGALLATPMRAQVTVGDLKTPESFSIMELISNGQRGLRLPQLTQLQRDTLDGTAGTAGISDAMQVSRDAFLAEKTGKAEGLTIFNTTTKCVDTWNGSVWISACACTVPPAQPSAITLHNGGLITDGSTDVDFSVEKEDGVTYTWEAVSYTLEGSATVYTNVTGWFTILKVFEAGDPEYVAGRYKIRTKIDSQGEAENNDIHLTIRVTPSNGCGAGPARELTFDVKKGS
jgi:hypothetical protein